MTLDRNAPRQEIPMDTLTPTAFRAPRRKADA